MTGERINDDRYVLGRDKLGRKSWRRKDGSRSPEQRAQSSAALHALSGSPGAEKRVVLRTQEEKVLYRRQAVADSIQRSRVLTDDERRLLRERMGFFNNDVPVSLEEVAKKYNVTRLDVRKMEADAMRKLTNEDPDLGAMFRPGWL